MIHQGDRQPPRFEAWAPASHNNCGEVHHIERLDHIMPFIRAIINFARNLCWSCANNKCHLAPFDNTCNCCRNNHSI